MTAITTMSSQPLSGKGLYTFAPEVRGMIFEEVLSGTWYGETHELIYALRGSRLYLEAVDTLARTNIFRLHEGNEWSFGNMSQAAINTIRNLAIEFVGGAQIIRHMFRPKNVWRLKHLRSLTLETSRVVVTLDNFTTEQIPVLRRLTDMILQTCSIIAYGIYYNNASYNRLTKLTIFTAGAPAPDDGNDVSEEDPLDWTFDVLGHRIIETFNSAVEGESNKAVLARVSSSDIQEWLWKCSKGVFVRDSTRGVDFSPGHTNSDTDEASGDSDDSESSGNRSISGSDNSDLNDEEEDDSF